MKINYEENPPNKINNQTKVSDSPISFEDKTKRNEYTKYYRKLDGSYDVSVYSEAVHYFEDNTWKDIDNRLVLDNNTNEYENKENSFKIKLPKKLNTNKSFKLKYDNYHIDWTINDINKTDLSVIESNTNNNINNFHNVENINQKTIYKNIQPNVNLEYILSGNKIKENIILNNYIENYSLTYHFKLKNLVLKEINGNVVFVNEQGQSIFSLGQFYMYDSNFNNSSNIEIKINKLKDKEFELKIIPDDHWLKNSDRVYPITIDPTIGIISNGDIPIRDKYTDGTSFLDKDYLKVGNQQNINYHSYIELSLLNEILSAHPVITNATLQLDVVNGDCYYYGYADDDLQINVREVKQEYSYVEINSNTDISNITKPEIIDYVNGYDIDPLNPLSYKWDITKVLQRWIYDGRTAGVFEISADNETNKYAWFDSSEVSNDETKPLITISYVDQIGLNDYWTYHSQSAGDAGNGYINDYTGNLTFIHDDYLPNSNLFSYGISHIYNSAKYENIGYGYGWNVNANVAVRMDDSNQLYFQEADGSRTYFYSLPDDEPCSYGQCYIAEDGSGLMLHSQPEQNGDMTYTLELPNGIVVKVMYSQFERQNIFIDAKTNNYLYVQYKNSSSELELIERISDNVGNHADFKYNDNDRLDKIIIYRKDSSSHDQEYKEIHFDYQDKKLYSIEDFYPDVNSETFKLKSEEKNLFLYDNLWRLNDVKNTYDNGLHYTYNSSLNQVKKVELYSNVNSVKKYISKMDIDYQFKQTRFTDESGNFEIYTFDNYGHTINIVDNKGNAQVYKYYNLSNNSPGNYNWNLNHKLIGVSEPQQNHFSNTDIDYTDDRNNLISNPSFESNTTNWTSNGFYRTDSVNDDPYNDILGDYSIEVQGNGDSTNNIKQTINITGNAGDTFIFGGWAKGYTQPNNIHSEKIFRVSVTIFEKVGLKSISVCEPDPVTFQIVCHTEYERVYSPQTYYLDFNPDIETWQYIMNEVKTTASYNKIIFSIEYKGEGTVHFDGLQLYKDNFGTNYTYVGENNPTDLKQSGKLESVDSPGTNNDIHYYYNSDNEVNQITNSDGTTTDIEYKEKKIETISKNNVKINFEYDGSGNVTEETIGDTSAFYFKTSTSYTNYNEFVNETTDQYGNTVHYDYDPVTGLLNELSYLSSDEPHDIITTYKYDSFGRLITVSKDSANNTYRYKDDKLWKIEVNGYYYEFIYDEFNRIQEVKVNDQSLMAYEYYTETDGNIDYNQNKIHNQDYGNGDRITFEYDDEDRVKNIKFNDITRYSYEYDYAGRISVYHDYNNSDTFTYHYDLSGRLESVTDQNSNNIILGYNSNGQLSDYDYTIDGKETNTDLYYYTYGNFKGMYNKTVFNVDGKTITKDYQYDDDSLKRLNNIALSISGSTINQSVTYDDQSIDPNKGNASTRIKTLTYDINGLSYTYTYDNLGNITHIKVDENNKIEEYDYSYNDLNQLEREYIDLEGTENDHCYEYQYDNNGNITSKKEYQIEDGIVTNNYTEIIYSYNNAWKDQLTNYNGEEIHYDGSGNPVTIGQDITLEWDGRELVKYTDTSQNLVIEYKYNDQGYRTKKTVTKDSNTTTTDYYLDVDKVLQEKITKGTNVDIISYFYDADGSITGFSYNNNVYLYIRNLQGDITKIVDETGNVVVSYTYDAWGNLLDINDTSGDNLGEINSYGYRGYRYDNETGFYYLNSRYYNPEIGRFINADGQIGQPGDILGHNMYAYAMNNPVMMVDPNGDFPFLIAMAIIGLAVGGGVGLGVGLHNGDTGWDLAKDVLIGGGIGAGAGLLLGAGISGALTGSFFTSISGVYNGAKLMYGMYQTAGFTAAYYMGRDNMSNAFRSFTHVFWSGGYMDNDGNVIDIAKLRAVNLANSLNGKTLEMTKLGMYLERIGAPSQAWTIASQNFASQVSNYGTAYAVLYYPGMSESGVWLTTELPELIRKYVEVIIGG